MNTADSSKTRPRIPRNVKALGTVSLLTDASSDMVYPVLPLFLANVIGAPVAVIGLIESIAEATAALLKVFSGWVSDRVGRRRPLIVAGYGISNLAKPLIALTTSWQAVLALRWTDRLGKGVRTAPRDAFIADSSCEETRGRDFGFHRALDTVGAAIGPVVAWGVLTIAPSGYRTVFLLSAIPGVAALLVLLVAVREPGARERALQRNSFRLRRLGRPFAAFASVSAVFALGNFSVAILILRAQDLGATASLVPLMYFVSNVIAAALCTHMGALSDRIGRRRLLTIGFVLFGAVYAGFALARGALAPWFLFAAYGVPYAMTDGVSRAYVVDLVAPDVRATAVGGYTFVLGLGALASSAIAGVLWDAVSPVAPFTLGAALMLAAAAGLVVAPALRRT